MANFINNLTEYVANNKELLIKNLALALGDTRKRISIQTGIKKDGAINILDLAPVFADGSECGFSAAGTATLSDRIIETKAIKVNMEICPKTLLGTYPEYLVRMNASANEIPFEQYVVEALVNEIAKKIEKGIWQGDTPLSLDGLLDIAAADVPSGKQVTNGGTSAYADILAVYNLVEEAVLDKGCEIYVSPATFRQFMQEMVTKNYFHYNPGQSELTEFVLPGSDAKVVRTPGLAGTTKILATNPANLVYGCDMEGDAEDIKIWYSDDDDVVKVKATWNQGVQIAVPANAVLGK